MYMTDLAAPSLQYICIYDHVIVYKETGDKQDNCLLYIEPIVLAIIVNIVVRLLCMPLN